jgi:glycerol-3-phosphate dehydrogenase
MKSKRTVHRGLRVVQAGLWLYDRYAKWGSLPPRSLHRPDEPGVPHVSPLVARHLWAYSDAQVTYPERLVIAFLDDARLVSQQRGLDFRVFTYSQATLRGKTVEIRPSGELSAAPRASLAPAAIINATGAWVDRTLARLPVESRRLMGGTKGSHFLTHNAKLRELLGSQGGPHAPREDSLSRSDRTTWSPHGVYTEARDGRPVFLLPFGSGTLVGTTDIPFEGDPATAVATEEELDYLLAVANDVFPAASLARDDITVHYCGVRPLPYVDARVPAAITRRHQLVWNEATAVPLVSLVGGKLTTCRSLAEETAAAVLDRLGQKPQANSRQRPIPRSPIDAALTDDPKLVRDTDEPGIPGSPLPESLACYAIDHEWATRLEDLVERRLMLHFSPDLSRQTLADLAQALVESGNLAEHEVPAAVDRCAARLQSHFGIQRLGV